MQQDNRLFIAHTRQSDGEQQTLKTHLDEVAEICAALAGKIGMAEAGELIGLLHDFGKYSRDFQNYIRSATGLFEPDHDDAYVDAKAQKGKIDHSSAGAQWIWQALSKYGANGQGKICGQILALCVASHHSGLIDSLKPNGENGFITRMTKSDAQTHLEECQLVGDEILARAEALAGKTLVVKMFNELQALMQASGSNTIRNFNLGFWTRFLFSCLIDADRISSADFENPDNLIYRCRPQIPWQTTASDRLENHLQILAAQTEQATPIDAIRQDISATCQRRASEPQGIYSLTVPTGGGKTLASLRYALHHAQTHGLERIIYVIPYTSIIEQNAAAIRAVIEQDDDAFPWVLEHHSNLEPEIQTWHGKLAAENWDAPIILTTMVQFLETLFGGGTRGVRRLHQLASSVIVFDEIQTLPIRCTHLFCNALNFLGTQAKTTAVLCTATQPLLDKLQAPHKGQLTIPPQNELINDAPALFEQLRRVRISDKTCSPGWSEQEIAELALAELQDQGSCLVIVNTKAWAQALYLRCAQSVEADSLFHLSTSLCPAHRQALFAEIRQRLNEGLPVLCISTQLIEAGVDIDFACVIRFLAGLDSIAQAAGRCNRNGRRSEGIVHIVNPTDERLDMLPDIKIGRDKALRLLGEIGDQDLLSIDAMTLYFKYYFYERTDEMDYPLNAKQAARDDSLLNLLSANDKNIANTELWQLRQSFKTAAECFKAIDAPTQAVIVPYNDEAKALIGELCGLTRQFDAGAYRNCLRRAQRFSVNVFPQVWRKLLEQQAVQEVRQGEGVYYLDERFYSPDFGLSTEIVGKAETLIW